MAQLSDAEKMFLEVAPYASFPIGSWNFADVIHLQFFPRTLDTSCVECGKDAVFRSLARSLLGVFDGPRTGGASRPVSVENLLGDKQRAQWPYEDRPPGVTETGPFLLSEMQPLALAERVLQVSFACTRNRGH